MTPLPPLPFAPVFGPDRWCIDLVPAPALGYAVHALQRSWADGRHGPLIPPKGMSSSAVFHLGPWTVHLWKDGSAAARHKTHGVLPFPLLVGQRVDTARDRFAEEIAKGAESGLPLHLNLLSTGNVPYPVPSALRLGEDSKNTGLIPPKGWLHQTLDALMDAAWQVPWAKAVDVLDDNGVFPQGTRLLWWMPTGTVGRHARRWADRVAQALPLAVALAQGEGQAPKEAYLDVHMRGQAVFPDAVVRPASLQAPYAGAAERAVVGHLQRLLATDLASFDASYWTLKSLPGGRGGLRYLPVAAPTALELRAFPMPTPSAHQIVAARAWHAAHPEPAHA